MSRPGNERTLRALATLVRLREIEERRALESASRDRVSAETARLRVSEVERRRDEARGRLEQHGVRLRAFLATLGRQVARRQESLVTCEHELADSRRRHSEARSRRRILETLRDRRLEENDLRSQSD